uniref:Uncharacterized protein n=1 Tax=Panagrellus redivivus TaxID=6233 RepID=A0A7E4ZY78_PANRE
MQFPVLFALIVAVFCLKVEVLSDAVPCEGNCNVYGVKNGCPILVSIIGGPKQQLGTLKVNLNFSEAKARLS